MHHAAADGCGNGGPEAERGNEIEERRPGHRQAGRQDVRRNDRGDGIGGVVEPIEEIKNQRGDDDDDDKCEGVHCFWGGL